MSRVIEFEVQKLAAISPAQIALVGHPNVGKSVIFQRLTDSVDCFEYPGRRWKWRGKAPLPGFTLVDTPGVITFPPFSEDERVTARVLLYEPLQAILQVGDAKNLRRTLLLTTNWQRWAAAGAGLNMTDEAQARA
jgi:ferrous iron transport protein B